MIPVGDDGVVGIPGEEDGAAAEAEDVTQAPAKVLRTANLAWKKERLANDAPMCCANRKILILTLIKCFS